MLEGNLGLRISDILKLRLCDIVRDGDRYRLEITEQKTGKRRVFTVPLVIQQYIENYCLDQFMSQKEKERKQKEAEAAAEKAATPAQNI